MANYWKIILMNFYGLISMSSYWDKKITILKNRKYATRGIASIYSEQDSCFDTQPYDIKIPTGESPFDVHHIFDFVEHINMQSADICKTGEHFMWVNQLR